MKKITLICMAIFILTPMAYSRTPLVWNPSGWDTTGTNAAYTKVTMYCKELDILGAADITQTKEMEESIWYLYFYHLDEDELDELNALGAENKLEAGFKQSNLATVLSSTRGEIFYSWSLVLIDSSGDAKKTWYGGQNFEETIDATDDVSYHHYATNELTDIPTIESGDVLRIKLNGYVSGTCMGIFWPWNSWNDFISIRSQFAGVWSGTYKLVIYETEEEAEE